MKSTYWRGLGGAILSACCFGTMPFTAMGAYAEGLSPSALLAYRFALSIPFLYAYAKYKGCSLKVNTKELGMIGLASLGGTAITALLLFLSYQYMSTGIATVLHFSYALFVLLGGVLLFREKMEPLQGLAVLFGLGGAWLCIPGDGSGSWLGFLLALLSGVTYTFYILYMGHTSISEMETSKLALYICIFTATMVGLYSWAVGEWSLPMTAKGWLYCGSTSFLGTTLGVTLFQYGVKAIGGMRTSICSTLEPITSLVLGMLFLGESLNGETMVGSLFILSAVLITVWKDGQRKEG